MEERLHMVGKLPVFSIDNLTLIDINELVDKGYRFNLTADMDQETDDLEEYLHGNRDDNASVLTRGF